MDTNNLPKITLILIVVSLFVALISKLGANLDALEPLFISWYISNGLVEIKHGQVWRLVTPIFIHFGVLHLVFNLAMTWQLGEIIERRYGYVRFVGLVLVIAVSSNLAQFYTSGPLFGGMSGVLYGLFGFSWIASKFDLSFGYRINPAAVKILLAWFVLCWFNFFGLMGEIRIANMAHTGGLIMGMVLAFVAAQRGKEVKRTS